MTLIRVGTAKLWAVGIDSWFYGGIIGASEEIRTLDLNVGNVSLYPWATLASDLGVLHYLFTQRKTPVTFFFMCLGICFAISHHHYALY